MCYGGGGYDGDGKWQLKKDCKKDDGDGQMATEKRIARMMMMAILKDCKGCVMFNICGCNDV
jgi:hypothetical protein